MKQGYRLSIATGTHSGDRKYQQDQVAVWPHPRFAGCVLGVVADGMGGRTGGRQASNQVILTAEQLFTRYDPSQDDAQALLGRIALEAHTVIKLTAIAAEQEPHSTLAAFLVNPAGDCYRIHSGDSRIYQFRGRKLLSQTNDHSYVQTLVNQGQLTPQEAAVHPKSNVLLSCLGTDEHPAMDVGELAPLEIGDTLLACSDGLWHYYTSNELGMIMDTLPAGEATHYLIDKARQRAAGGGDNLSLIVLKVDPPPEDEKEKKRKAAAALVEAAKAGMR